jgi:hypothetical protein
MVEKRVLQRIVAEKPFAAAVAVKKVVCAQDRAGGPLNGAAAVGTSGRR